jgi:hypothetical protein
MTENQIIITGNVQNYMALRAHRRLIGILGLFLPVLLYVVAGLRPTCVLPRWDILNSVSSYYYTGAVGIFVGVLFALSLCLFTYPGYKDVLADRVAGVIGGAAALGVALFPTAAPEGICEPKWWRDSTGVVHYVSATVLFITFILFSIWLFRKSSIPERRDRPREKQRRDDVCLICGLVMIVSVLWTASALITKAPIFLPEAIAIMAFAVSWLVKGEAYQPVLSILRRFVSATEGE